MSENINIHKILFFKIFSDILYIRTLCGRRKSLIQVPQTDNHFPTKSSALFYALQRNFMPRQFSSLAGFYPDRGGVEATGQTASLLAVCPVASTP